MNGQEVHSAIRAYLRHVGCTLRSFAAACDVAPSTIDGWRTKDPSNEAPAIRALRFIAKNPHGFAGAEKPKWVQDHSGGGADALARAKVRSVTPARPCPRAVAAAAQEDAWSQLRRARMRGDAMVT